MNDTTNLESLIDQIRAAQNSLQSAKREQFDRRVSFGDLITDRDKIAASYGFGAGSTCYDNVLIIGDVVVGEHTWIGPGCVLDGSGGLTIGSHCTICAGSQIYTHDAVARTISLGQKPIQRTKTAIGSGVFLGPNTIVQMGVTIGDRVVVGAQSFVNRSIPSDSRAMGTPARVIE